MAISGKIILIIPAAYKFQIPEDCELDYEMSNVFVTMCDFKLLPQYKWNLHAYGMLCSLHQHLVTNISGKPISIIFKSQAVNKPVHKDVISPAMKGS